MKGQYFLSVLVALFFATASLTGACAQAKAGGAVKDASAPANPSETLAKATPAANVGIVYYTPYRVKFSDSMYIWVFCVLADGQTPTDVSSVLSSIGTIGASVVTGGMAAALLKEIPAQALLTPILKAIALKPGQAYCYHVKFADDNLEKIKFVYDTGVLAKDGPAAAATNSYIQRYTSAGISNGTFVRNAYDPLTGKTDLLGIEYPNCDATNCPCRGQFCQVRSFSPLSTDAPVVAASFCVEAPANAPTESFVVSFGAPEKITDAAKQPIPTDDLQLAPPYITVPAIGKSCAERGFIGTPVK
jgi:hypothetical protein